MEQAQLSLTGRVALGEHHVVGAACDPNDRQYSGLRPSLCSGFGAGIFPSFDDSDTQGPSLSYTSILTTTD